jgi:O-antigen/teichoic acid export membrane protein
VRNEITGRVLRNSIFRGIGYPIGAVLLFLTYILIARYLGAEGFGHFSFIMAFTGLFQIVADMGIRNILIRNISTDFPNFGIHLQTARFLMRLLSILSGAMILVISSFLNIGDEIRQSVYLAGMGVILTINALSYGSVIRAFEDMGIDIIGFDVHKIIFIALIWAVTKTELGIRGVFLAFLISNAALWLYMWGVVRVRYGLGTPGPDVRNSAISLFKEAILLGMAEILKRLMRDIDKFLLTALGTPSAVGLFSAPYKLLEAVTQFTVNLTLSLFPAYARLAKISSDRLFEVWHRNLKFLYIAAVPIAVTIFVFSDRIMEVMFGPSFREASSVLKIIAPAIVLIFASGVYRYIFVALGHQRDYLFCIAVSLGVNTAADMVLIPLYSCDGAAIGTLAGEITLFFSGLIMLENSGNSFQSLTLLIRPLIAGAAMAFIFGQVKDKTLATLIAGICCGFGVYAGLLFVLEKVRGRW